MSLASLFFIFHLCQVKVFINSKSTIIDTTEPPRDVVNSLDPDGKLTPLNFGWSFTGPIFHRLANTPFHRYPANFSGLTAPEENDLLTGSDKGLGQTNPSYPEDKLNILGHLSTLLRGVAVIAGQVLNVDSNG